ncbi:hypothetical protein AMR75_05295 [Vibrio fluvialis]|nr:hypothetical protein AMR75_05295 [Vibrio fluvialis]
MGIIIFFISRLKIISANCQISIGFLSDLFFSVLAVLLEIKSMLFMWLKRVIYHYDAGDLELVQQLEEKNLRTREFSLLQIFQPVIDFSIN